RHFDGTIFALALASAGLLAAVRASSVRTERGTTTWAIRLRPFRRAELRARLPVALVAMLALIASWHFGVRLVYWVPFEQWVTESLYRVLILIAALILVTL